MNAHDLRGAERAVAPARLHEGPFAQAVQASVALARQGQGMLVPALSGCRTCGTVQMIAAPALGRCKDCGVEPSVLDSTEPEGVEG